MSFLFPAFLIGGLAIAVPIVLHLLRRDVAPEVPFSAVHLLHKTPIERSKRRRLRDLLLLAARVAALLLLAAAFARPYRGRRRPAGADRRSSPSIVRSAWARPGRSIARGSWRERRWTRQASARVGGDRVRRAGRRVSAARQRGRCADGDRPAHGRASARRATAPAIARAAELAAGDPGRWSSSPICSGPAGRARSGPTLASNLDARWSRTSGRRPAMSPSATVRPQPAGGGRDGAKRGPRAVSRHRAADARRPRGGIGIGDARARTRAGTSSSRIMRPRPARWSPRSTTRRGCPPTTNGPCCSARRAHESHRRQGRDGTTGRVREARRVSISTRHSRRRRPKPPALEPVFVDGARFTKERSSLLSGAAAVVLLSTRELDRGARDALPAFVRNGGGLIVAAGPDVDATVLAGILGTTTAGGLPRSALAFWR